MEKRRFAKRLAETGRFLLLFFVLGVAEQGPLGSDTKPEGLSMPEAFYSASELNDAVVNGFLSQEEARTIYWSQFRTLREKAFTTPPAIGGEDA